MLKWWAFPLPVEGFFCKCSLTKQVHWKESVIPSSPVTFNKKHKTNGSSLVPRKNLFPKKCRCRCHSFSRETTNKSTNRSNPKNQGKSLNNQSQPINPPPVPGPKHRTLAPFDAVDGGAAAGAVAEVAARGFPQASQRSLEFGVPDSSFPNIPEGFFPKMFLEILVDFSSNMCLDFLGRCLENFRWENPLNYGKILGMCQSVETWACPQRYIQLDWHFNENMTLVPWN